MKGRNMKKMLVICTIFLSCIDANAENVIKLQKGFVHIDCKKDESIFTTSAYVREDGQSKLEGSALNQSRIFHWSKIEVKESGIFITAYWSNYPLGYNSDWYYLTVTKDVNKEVYKAIITTKEIRQWYEGQIEDSASMEPYGEPEISERSLGEFNCTVKQ